MYNTYLFIIDSYMQQQSSELSLTQSLVSNEVINNETLQSIDWSKPVNILIGEDILLWNPYFCDFERIKPEIYNNQTTKNEDVYKSYRMDDPDLLNFFVTPMPKNQDDYYVLTWIPYQNKFSKIRLSELVVARLISTVDERKSEILKNVPREMMDIIVSHCRGEMRELVIRYSSYNLHFPFTTIRHAVKLAKRIINPI